MPESLVLNVDCLEYIKTLPDKAFELAIVDPPYGIDGNSHRENQSRGKLAKAKRYHTALWDQPVAKEEYYQELFRVSINQIVWGANHFISRIPFDSPCWIIWDKLNRATDFADCELAWTSFKTAARKFDYNWNGMWQHDMKNKELRIHPTQKPVALYKWILKNYANEGDKILDTHLGSGSSRIAAYDMGFDFVGCELDIDYYNAGNKRFEQYKAQLKLF